MGGISIKNPLGTHVGAPFKQAGAGWDDMAHHAGIKNVGMATPFGRNSALQGAGYGALAGVPGGPVGMLYGAGVGASQGGDRAGYNMAHPWGAMSDLMDPGNLFNTGGGAYGVEKKQREAEQRAADLAQLQARQSAMAQGVGGGGVQVGMENYAGNSVRAQYERQIAETHMAQQQQSMQNLASLLSLIALFA